MALTINGYICNILVQFVHICLLFLNKHMYLCNGSLYVCVDQSKAITREVIEFGLYGKAGGRREWGGVHRKKTSLQQSQAT